MPTLTLPVCNGLLSDCGDAGCRFLSETVKVTWGYSATTSKEQLHDSVHRTLKLLHHRCTKSCLFKVQWSSTQSAEPPTGESAVVVFVVNNNITLMSLSHRCYRAPVIQWLLILNMSCVQIAQNSTLHFSGPLTIHTPSERLSRYENHKQIIRLSLKLWQVLDLFMEVQ